MAPPVEESAALVMRLATLIFSSPIAIWKLQNEVLRALDAARVAGAAVAAAHVARIFVLCASLRRACDGPLSA